MHCIAAIFVECCRPRDPDLTMFEIDFNVPACGAVFVINFVSYIIFSAITHVVPVGDLG